VGTVAGEDGEGVDGGVEVSTLGVGAGDVAAEQAEFGGVVDEDEGDVGGDEAGGAHGDERGQRVGLHEVMQDWEARFLVGFGDVHGAWFECIA